MKLEREKNMIYLTSDLHFCHNKEFLYQPRGFDNVEDMNNTIVKNWNSTVNINDDIYILGDLMLNDNKKGFDLLSSLNGKLHIILGNHDTDNRVKLYRQCWNVKEIVHATRLKYQNHHFFLSHYPCLCSNFDVDKPLKQRLISLCGHSHTKNQFQDMDKGLIYHVELDAHDCKPVDIETIIRRLYAYEIKEEVCGGKYE